MYNIICPWSPVHGARPNDEAGRQNSKDENAYRFRKVRVFSPSRPHSDKTSWGEGEQATNDREDEGKAWNTFIAESPVLQY